MGKVAALILRCRSGCWRLRAQQRLEFWECSENGNRSRDRGPNFQSFRVQSRSIRCPFLVPVFSQSCFHCVSLIMFHLKTKYTISYMVLSIDIFFWFLLLIVFSCKLNCWSMYMLSNALMSDAVLCSCLYISLHISLISYDCFTTAMFSCTKIWHCVVHLLLQCYILFHISHARILLLKET